MNSIRDRANPARRAERRQPLAVERCESRVVLTAGVCVPNATTVDLVAGRHIDSGDVVVTSDAQNLYVTFKTENGWTLKETHLSIGSSLKDIPANRGGNPTIGRFQFQANHAPGTTEFTYTIPLADVGLENGAQAVVAAHAVVQRAVPGAPAQQETAWGQGSSFPGSNWAMYFGHMIDDCVFLDAATADADDDAQRLFNF